MLSCFVVMFRCHNRRLNFEITIFSGALQKFFLSLLLAILDQVAILFHPLEYTYLFNTYAVIPSAILISFEAVPIGYSALINALFPRTGPACNSAIPSLHTYPARPQNKRTANVSTSTFAVLYCVLPYAAFHLVSNKSVQLYCILHRKFFGEWLHEAHDDHFGRLGLAEATAHQVVQLLFGDLGNFRFVLQGDSAVVNFVERDCVGSGDVVHDDRVAFDMRD